MPLAKPAYRQGCDFQGLMGQGKANAYTRDGSKLHSKHIRPLRKLTAAMALCTTTTLPLHTTAMMQMREGNCSGHGI